MGGPLLYTTSEAATLTAQWPLTQWKDIASKVAWGQQPLCQPYQHLQSHSHSPVKPSSTQLQKKRLEENSTGGHGWEPAEHLAVIIPTADSYVLQSRPNEGMLIYIPSQEHSGAQTLTNRGPSRL